MSTWNNSVQYSSDDMLRMQQEAIQRVQEMQRQSAQRVNHTNLEEPPPTPIAAPRSFSPPQPHFVANQGQPIHRQPSPPSPPQSKGASGILSGLLGGGLGDTVNNLSELPKKAFSSISSVLEGFGLDNEKIILIVLIFLLANEEGDKTLLLALGYLLFF